MNRWWRLCHIFHPGSRSLSNKRMSQHISGILMHSYISAVSMNWVFILAADAGFPTRSLSPLSASSSSTTTKSSNPPNLQIQIPSIHYSAREPNFNDTSSPTPLPGPESAPIHPFAHSTAKLELLPPSTAGLSGIDIEEEARLYDELRRTAKSELPPVNNSNFVLHSLRFWINP